MQCRSQSPKNTIGCTAMQFEIRENLCKVHFETVVSEKKGMHWILLLGMIESQKTTTSGSIRTCDRQVNLPRHSVLDHRRG